MKIEIPIEVGDMVFVYSNKIKKIINAPIHMVQAKQYERKFEVEFWIKNPIGDYEIFNEVYTTKEQLIAAIS